MNDTQKVKDAINALYDGAGVRASAKTRILQYQTRLRLGFAGNLA